MVNYTAKYLPQSKLEVTLNITDDQLKEEYTKALRKIAEKTEVRGFRKGKAPIDMVEESIGKEKVYEDAINSLLPKKLEEALKTEAEKDTSHQMVVLDYPKFSINDQWKPGETLVVVSEVSLYPKFDISKLDQLSIKKAEKKEVTDKDIEDAVNKIFEQYKHIKEHEKKQKDQNVITRTETATLVDAQGNALIASDEKELKIDDEFAVAAGAKDLANLKEMLKSELESEAIFQAEKDNENELIKTAISLIDIDMPQILVDEELNRIQIRFQNQLERFGMTVESYLSSENKTLEEQRDQWKQQALENSKIALILSELQRKKEIQVSEEEIKLLSAQSGIKGNLSREQYISLRYIVGQTKALDELKKLAGLK
jgi:trigger factor